MRLHGDGELPSPGTPHACSSCGLRFASRNKLFGHLRAAHGLEPLPAQEKVVLVVAYVGTCYRGLQCSATSRAASACNAAARDRR